MLLRAIVCCLVLSISPFTALNQRQTLAREHQHTDKSAGSSAPRPSQDQVISVVLELLDKSKTFSDDYLRVRFAAQVADTLWRVDKEHAQTLLTDAFRAIDSLKAPADPPGPVVYRGASTNLPLRLELLRIAGLWDPALAQKLAQPVGTEAAGAGPGRWAPTGAPGAAVPSAATSNDTEILWLAIAEQTIGRDQHNAIALAKAALKKAVGNNEILMGFIRMATALRATDLTAADEMFAYAISETANHPQFALASIRFLGLYCFPDSGGMIRYRTIPPRSPSGESVDASATSINRFLTFVYSTVLRLSSTDQPPNGSAEGGARRWVGNDYYPVQLLIPYFDRYMPEKLRPFQEKLELLVQSLLAGQTATDGLEPADPNNIDAQIAAAGQTRYPEVRDSLYDRAVELALMDNDYDEALILANKISSASLRSAAASRVRQALVSSNIQNKDFNAAYSYCSQAPIGERTPLLMSIARAAAATDKPKARQLLSEAMQLLESFDDTSFKSSQRLTAMSVASDVDTELGFDAMKLAVNQINRTGYGLMGQDKAAPSNSASTSTQQRMSYTVTMISFDGAFRRLAQADFSRTLQLARAIAIPELSAMAQLSVCRSALSGCS